MIEPCPHCGAKQDHYCKPLADRVVGWFPKYCTHTKGRWAGKPLELMPYTENDLIRPAFGLLVWDEELGQWVRQTREAYCEIPRKNAKSTVGAGISLRLLTADGEQGAEIYSIAEDMDQARVVFGIARAMVEASEDLSRRCKVFRSLIEVPKTGNIYRVLPGDAAGSHGLNVHGLIIDEYHTQKNRELVDVMTTAQGARAQPITFGFTTAGTDKHSICREKHDYGEQVKAGLIDDRSFLYVRYGVPENEPYDWEDEELWKRCNPALGTVLTMSFLRAEYQKAKASPGRQNAFRNLYLNDWTEQAIRFIDLGTWDASAGIVDESQLKGEACFGGLDASHSQGIASLCWDFGDARLWRLYLPKDLLPQLNEQTAGQASGWAREGVLTLTDGDVTDYEQIKAQVIADGRKFSVKEIGYNSHAISPLVNNLMDEGFKMIPISQGITTLSPGTKEWERQVIAGGYRHGGNPVLRWMVDGLAVKRGPDGTIKPDKEASKVNISGITAGVMALDRRMRHVEKPVKKPGRLVTF